MIYAIWECDGHSSLDTYCFKGFFTEIKEARNTYNKWKDAYRDHLSNGWILNFGEYQPDIRLDGNAISDFKVIESTEE